MTPLLLPFSSKTYTSQKHRYLRGIEAVSQRDLVRSPPKNIWSNRSRGLLFKKPELFKIGSRSSELGVPKEHRREGGVPSHPPMTLRNPGPPSRTDSPTGCHNPNPDGSDSVQP